jgi:DHA2 family multidrug resistance protein
MAGASGMLTFARILSGAIFASIITTSWESETTHMRAELAARAHGDAAIQAMTNGGMSVQQATEAVSGMVQGQAVMLATNNMFAIMAPIVFAATALIWLNKKPAPGSRMGGGH